MPTKKLYLASAFQFTLLGLLGYALFAGLGEPDMIIGIFAGIMVGIGTEQISQPYKEPKE